MEELKNWFKDMGYEKKSEVIGEVAAWISLIATLFVLSVIGG